jgi:hypothetical protein
LSEKNKKRKKKTETTLAMARQPTVMLLVTLAVAAAALVHPGSHARRCSVRHRCVPVANLDRISENNRAARLRKQQEREADADRAARSLLEQQQQVALKAHRAAIENFEGSNDWRGALNELHLLRKQVLSATHHSPLTPHSSLLTPHPSGHRA